MKTIDIKGYKREHVGKSATKALRNVGQIPCILYGGNDVIHFAASEKAFRELIYTPDIYTATIDLEGKKYLCILQDIQFHPVTDKILHMDFYRLFDNKHVTLEIPVRLVGNSPGVIAGGSLRFPSKKLKIRSLPADLPDTINVDISTLNIGDKLYVNQIPVENFVILNPKNTVVVQVGVSRVAKSNTTSEQTEQTEQKEQIK